MAVLACDNYRKKRQHVPNFTVQLISPSMALLHGKVGKRVYILPINLNLLTLLNDF